MQDSSLGGARWYNMRATSQKVSDMHMNGSETVSQEQVLPDCDCGAPRGWGWGEVRGGWGCGGGEAMLPQ